MAIFDVLVTRNPNDLDVNSWLAVDEVLRRIVQRFPLAIIDRERGDRIVRERKGQLGSQHNLGEKVFPQKFENHCKEFDRAPSTNL